MSNLLEIDAMSVLLATSLGPQKAVDDISVSVAAGEILGIAGESGSGKTLTALALLGLLPHGARTTGTACFEGSNLLEMSARRLREVRGNEIAMVSQDPNTSLHPMLNIETQLTEHMRHHLGVSKSEARSRAIELLVTVRIPDPDRALSHYAGQFSGGMRQRIAIASALACEPRLLVADEPTTALDVTVQAGILNLLDRLRRERGLTVVLITHDLGVMSSIADRVCVMYGGRIIETGPRAQVLSKPRHPYRHGLLRALPHPESVASALRAIPGSPPRLGRVPAGCPFEPRCEYSQPGCAQHRPPLVEVMPGHLVACPIDPLAGIDD